MSTADPFSSRFEVFGRFPRRLVPDVNSAAFRRLMRLLDLREGDDGRVILLRAPRAGFGKTTLLQRAAAELRETHHFVRVNLVGGRTIDAAHVLEYLLQALCNALPDSATLTHLDLLARRIMALGLEPLVRSGEVPCQDREGALVALREQPVETFDFHHDRAVTAHWTKSNFEILGPRLAAEVAQMSGASLREASYWVELLFRFSTTAPDNVERTRLLFETVFRGDLRNMTESAAGERLGGLLCLLSMVTRIVLIVDDTEGLSTHPPDALELGSFLTNLAQSSSATLVVLSVNGDVWETAFLPRLPGGLADRLQEFEVSLGPLTAEEARRLVEERAGQYAEAILAQIDWDAKELYARDVLKMASDAWEELGFSIPPETGDMDAELEEPAAPPEEEPVPEEPTAEEPAAGEALAEAQPIDREPAADAGEDLLESAASGAAAPSEPPPATLEEVPDDRRLSETELAIARALADSSGMLAIRQHREVAAAPATGEETGEAFPAETSAHDPAALSAAEREEQIETMEGDAAVPRAEQPPFPPEEEPAEAAESAALPYPPSPFEAVSSPAPGGGETPAEPAPPSAETPISEREARPDEPEEEPEPVSAESPGDAPWQEGPLPPASVTGEEEEAAFKAGDSIFAPITPTAEAAPESPFEPVSGEPAEAAGGETTPFGPPPSEPPPFTPAGDPGSPFKPVSEEPAEAPAAESEPFAPPPPEPPPFAPVGDPGGPFKPLTEEPAEPPAAESEPFAPPPPEPPSFAPVGDPGGPFKPLTEEPAEAPAAESEPFAPPPPEPPPFAPVGDPGGPFKPLTEEPAEAPAAESEPFAPPPPEPPPFAPVGDPGGPFKPVSEEPAEAPAAESEPFAPPPPEPPPFAPVGDPGSPFKPVSEEPAETPAAESEPFAPPPPEPPPFGPVGDPGSPFKPVSEEPAGAPYSQGPPHPPGSGETRAGDTDPAVPGPPVRLPASEAHPPILSPAQPPAGSPSASPSGGDPVPSPQPASPGESPFKALGPPHGGASPFGPGDPRNPGRPRTELPPKVAPEPPPSHTPPGPSPFEPAAAPPGYGPPASSPFAPIQPPSPPAIPAPPLATR